MATNAKGINTNERLMKAFPELPLDVLLKEHNNQERWNKLVGEIDQFVEQNATPATPARTKS